MLNKDVVKRSEKLYCHSSRELMSVSLYDFTGIQIMCFELFLEESF